MPQPVLERPDVIRVLFYPRRDIGLTFSTSSKRVIVVDIELGITIGGRLYPVGSKAPAILFFHGNGEIATDYDDIAPLYTQRDITLLVIDYRGYGISTGTPTGSSLLTDAVAVFNASHEIFSENGLSPSRLYIMGRSLGSAAAIEVVLNAGDRIDGLIIESGFADTFALLTRLGVRIEGADDDRDGFGNLSKIGKITTRTLIIHGENDVLIPSGDGQRLYDHCGAADKQLVLIPGAGHNDLMYVGLDQYFEALRIFLQR